MVYSVKCVVCGIKNLDYPNISFHIIPKNLEKKRLWVESLNLQVEHLKVNNKVCSLHFKMSDYMMSTDRKLLLSNAIPKLAGSNKNEIVQSNVEPNKQSGTIVLSPIVEETSVTDVEVANALKRTPTAHDDTTLMTTPKKKKMWSSSRFGDLSDEDFSTPRRLKRSFSIVKNRVKKLSYANKLLTQKNKRLENKIRTLSDIIDELKKKSLLNESSADIIKLPMVQGYKMDSACRSSVCKLKICELPTPYIQTNKTVLRGLQCCKGFQVGVDQKRV